ncbi:MAG TPA: cob(I)yrinic acid a,c-diamide adenosyltransferase [Haliscomenobacter sp.]|uniref:cob(I)yrinic acid a,c-diamide adenosyltransferase n=1 Tax=Haliscomenobacter sp. TaxID=2717303 RepID=UPI002B9757E2|nr:cob(I)yrinic acid a,c-diamide adenosyltransferase [Haliscomenobacter sp.]HOY16442.1 cob(I)yrinic acid a,c-diamide adenosyltransferase [Haliscomenobacter sp.]HPH19694.1 cob(I)yrinic acid a,c-diamide adenosyltransferase [Haliscomenobacter sp.]
MAFKIYTKTGDKGETGLFGGKRLPKYDLRIESYGTVDELNSYIGLLRDFLQDEATRDFLKAIQDRLFTIGANLASDPDKSMSTPDLLETDVQALEQQMDRMDETLPALKNFILPGGHPTVSYCHIARTVCRRAERQVVALAANEAVDEIIMVYLNRLSDYLFVLSRKVAQDLNVAEVSWHARK